MRTKAILLEAVVQTEDGSYERQYKVVGVDLPDDGINWYTIAEQWKPEDEIHAKGIKVAR